MIVRYQELYVILGFLSDYPRLPVVDYDLLRLAQRRSFNERAQMSQLLDDFVE